MARRPSPEVLAFVNRLSQQGRQRLLIDHLSPTPSSLLGGLLADLLPSLTPKKKRPPQGRLLKPVHEESGSTTAAALEDQQQREPPNPQQDHPDLLKFLLTRYGRTNSPAQYLGLGRHFCYWPLRDAPSQLAPDGADAWHAPGGKFTERLWTGGRVVWWDVRGAEALRLDGRRAWGVEGVEDVVENGGSVLPAAAEGEAVLQNERSVREEARGAEAEGQASTSDRVTVVLGREYWPTVKHEKKRRKQQDSIEVMADGSKSYPVIISEKRYLSFLTKNAYAKLLERKMPERKAPSNRSTQLSAPCTPTPDHLFAYSALTYNAHHVHRECAANTHPPLVHGNLAVTLMLAVAARGFEPREKAARFTYRLRAMMHAGERFQVHSGKARILTWDDLLEEAKAEKKAEGGKDVGGEVTKRFLANAERDGEDGFVVNGKRQEVLRRLVWIEGPDGNVRASGEVDSVRTW